jgi:hypothetical protein
MNKLTLPIQIDKKYVRRDGTTCTASYMLDTPGLVCFDIGSSLWMDNGARDKSGRTYSADDLVSDYEDSPERKEHSHAELLRWIAGSKEIEWERSADVWVTISHRELFYALSDSIDPMSKFRLKPEPPKTIRIGDFDVPKPLQKKPECGARYWVVSLTAVDAYCELYWDNDASDRRYFARGLIHADKESAEIHTKAILSLTQISE